MRKSRNTGYVVQQSRANYDRCVESQLMQLTLLERHGKTVVLPDGRPVVEFVNCSYLGLDLHPQVIAAAQRVVEEWGVHFCCARSRFSIEPNRQLEEGLSDLFRGRAITFPSVTSAHMSVLPLVASGVLLDPASPPPVRLIFDKFAHASMQYLKPILATEATLAVIAHNSVEELRQQVLDARANGEAAVYVADGVYSMGGVCPIAEVLALSRELDFHLYIDDAHGTSIFGDQGEGYVVSHLEGAVPENLFLSYSLAKGFGCNGGGVVVPDAARERLVRSFGQTYAFSAPLDFSIIGAALAALALHRDGTVRELQKTLRHNVALFDEALRAELPFSPIRMVRFGPEDQAIAAAERLLAQGFYVSVAFFPIVGRNDAQLRICIAAQHTRQEIDALAELLTSGSLE